MGCLRIRRGRRLVGVADRRPLLRRHRARHVVARRDGHRAPPGARRRADRRRVRRRHRCRRLRMAVARGAPQRRGVHGVGTHRREGVPVVQRCARCAVGAGGHGQRCVRRRARRRRPARPTRRSCCGPADPTGRCSAYRGSLQSVADSSGVAHTVNGRAGRAVPARRRRQGDDAVVGQRRWWPRPAGVGGAGDRRTLVRVVGAAVPVHDDVRLGFQTYQGAATRSSDRFHGRRGRAPAQRSRRRADRRHGAADRGGRAGAHDVRGVDGRLHRPQRAARVPRGARRRRRHRH